MNKELTLKYKKEFDHWLNDGSVLTGFRNLTSNQIKWYPSITNPFIETSTSSEILVIINDEYVEFRKALAEGKTIQVWDIVEQHLTDPKLDVYDWRDFKSFTQSSPFTYSPDRYRIKPEEPKFKVGDWVFLEFINLDKNDKYRVCKAKIEGIRDNSYYNDKECTSLISELPNNEGDWIITGLWQPEPSEWCWNSIFGLVKVICEATENRNPCYLCWNPWKKSEQKLTNLEPFIGELPSHLKD